MQALTNAIVRNGTEGNGGIKRRWRAASLIPPARLRLRLHLRDTRAEVPHGGASQAVRADEQTRFELAAAHRLPNLFWVGWSQASRSSKYLT